MLVPWHGRITSSCDASILYWAPVGAPATLLLIQLPVNTPWAVAEDGSSTCTLPPTCETRMEFWAVVFGLAQQCKILSLSLSFKERKYGPSHTVPAGSALQICYQHDFCSPWLHPHTPALPSIWSRISLLLGRSAHCLLGTEGQVSSGSLHSPQRGIQARKRVGKPPLGDACSL